MGDRDDIARLMRWDAEGQIPPAAYDRLQSHPRYEEAMRSLSSRMLAAAREDKALDGIAKDVGRYVVAQWAVYLHASGGLTLPRLKHICSASRLLSPGRARAALLYLRYLGYVETVGGRVSGQPTRYAPTFALTAAWKRLVQESLAAVRIVEPAADIVLSRLEFPDVLETYLKHQGEGFLAAAAAFRHDETPFFRVFAHRHAGMQMLHWIVRASLPADGYPPSEPVSAPSATLSRELRVSRTHIKRMLREAENEGFVVQGDEGQLLLTERLRTELRWVLSSVMLGLLVCAAKTARDAIASRIPLTLTA